MSGDSGSLTKKRKTDIFDNIRELNDDCLQHIFKWLPTSDLCSIYETCKRFKNVVDEYFKAFRSKTVTVQIPQCGKHQRKIIQYFKQHTRRIRIEFSEDVIDQIEKVIESCNGKISSIDIDFSNVSWFEMGYEPFKILKNILHNLEEVNVCCGFLTNELVDCKNMKSLSLHQCFSLNGESWMNHSYPKLRSLMMYEFMMPDRETFQSFLDKNRNIEHFSCVSDENDESNVWILKDIMQYANNLQEIEFGCGASLINEDLTLLCNCEKLKNLQISVTHEENSVEILTHLFNSLVNHKSLEGLGYKGDLTFNLCKAMSKLTNLKVLSLYLVGHHSCRFCCDLLSIKLINLERLFIDFDPVVNQKHHLPFMKFSKKLKKMYLRTILRAGGETNLFLEAMKRRNRTVDDFPLAAYANKALVANVMEIFVIKNAKAKEVTIVPFEYEVDGMFSKSFFRGHKFEADRKQ